MISIVILNISHRKIRRRMKMNKIAIFSILTLLFASSITFSQGIDLIGTWELQPHLTIIPDSDYDKVSRYTETGNLKYRFSEDGTVVVSLGSEKAAAAWTFDEDEEFFDIIIGEIVYRYTFSVLDNSTIIIAEQHDGRDEIYIGTLAKMEE